jgi:hypothetical protein
VAAAAAPPADLRWRAVRMPQIGASLELPGVPVESTMYLPKPQSDWLVRNVEIAADEANHHVHFAFSRLDVATADRRDDQAVLDRVPSALKSVDTRDPLTVGGFHGISFQGTSDDGHAIIEHVVIAGRSLFILEVDSPPGAMPVADARRFLDSFRLDLAWSVVPMPDIRCTVALPDAVLALRSKDEPGSAAMRTHNFYLGGTGEIVYYVAASHIDASVLAEKTPAQLLDATAQAIGQLDGGKLHGTTPISLDGLDGRDVRGSMKSPEKEVHTRMFIVGQTLYQVGIAAKTAELVTDEGARRFLGSLRIDRGL